MRISWTIKGLILLMHGATMNLRGLGQIKFLRTAIGVVLNTKKFVQTDLASLLVKVLHKMHVK